MSRRLPPPLLQRARAQGGLVCRRQVRAFGLSDGVIRSQLQSGRWRQLHPGVYLIQAVDAHNRVEPAPPIISRGQESTAVWAALLYAGEGATVSHRTAADLWGLGATSPVREDPTVHVCVPVHRRVYSRPTVRIHYAHRLPHTRHPSRRPPVTRVEETVLDLVDVASRFDEVLTWVTRACQRRRTTPIRLQDALAARKKIRWREELMDLLADVDMGAESPLELAYLDRVERAHGLPTGRRQVHRYAALQSQWIDVDYVEYATRVELDGRLGHEGDGTFRDRRRDNLSTVEGLRTLRYGWSDTFTDGCATAGEVGQVLQANGWQGKLRRCGPGCGLDLGIGLATP